MKRTLKYSSKLATAMLAGSLAFAMAPALRAQATATSNPPPAAEMNNRLQDLETEVGTLQKEIEALKASENASPTMANASLVQQAPPAATPAPAAPAPINLAGLLGSITISGFGDVYYGYNYNHPGDNQSGLVFFEAPTNNFSLNLAEVILDKPADTTSAENRLGYHMSLAYGEAAKVVNGSDVPFTDGSNFFVKEAYFSYIAPVGKGLTVTVGKFVTNAGAEVIETNADWNYTHSMLFYYAVPFFHFGAKAAYTFNPKWTVNASLVNGWNNTVISHQAAPGNSAGLTYGGSVIYTPSKLWTVTENYYGGPILTGGNSTGTATTDDWKHLSDTIIAYTPNAKWALQVNGDYAAVITSPKKITYWGVAPYAKYTMSPKTNFAVRYEYFDDTNGFAGVLFGTPGFAQEVTGTYSYNLTSALLVRGEYRYDFAQQPIFEKGPKFVKDQNTAYLSFVYSFSSANAK